MVKLYQNQKYSRSVDGVILNVSSFEEVSTKEDFTLVEIKTTNSKSVTELPYGVFFGFTKNEEDLFKKLDNYRLCIVHTGFKKHSLLTFKEYESLIRNKRVQYQINFKSKD